MKRFEYRVGTTPELDENYLDEQGLHGWQLIKAQEIVSRVAVEGWKRIGDQPGALWTGWRVWFMRELEA